MFADHQRNKLTRVMLAQMKQCDGFDFGVDETTAFSWPAIHPQDDCIWEVPCFVAAAARTKQDVVTLTNDLVTGDFLGDDVIENCWYVWSANSTVSERRANKRDCLEKFVRARGWLSFTDECILHLDLAPNFVKRTQTNPTSATG